MDVKIRGVAAALALTAIATAVSMLLRPGKALALGLDLVPFVSALAATAWVAVRLRRETASLRRWLVALTCHGAGALVGTLGVAHSSAVLIVALGRARQQQFTYDFRFYSLLLFGALLMVSGLAAARNGAMVAEGSHSAWRASLWIWAGILAMNLPLIPLQGFAALFSGLATLALLLLAGLRRFLGHVETERGDLAPGTFDAFSGR